VQTGEFLTPVIIGGDVSIVGLVRCQGGGGGRALRRERVSVPGRNRSIVESVGPLAARNQGPRCMGCGFFFFPNSRR